MMDLYAVVGAYDYEGLSEPLAIFDNLKEAECLRIIYMRQPGESSLAGYDEVYIIKYTLNLIREV